MCEPGRGRSAREIAVGDLGFLDCAVIMTPRGKDEIWENRRDRDYLQLTNDPAKHHVYVLFSPPAPLRK